jgi:hypothetical protein
MVLSACNLIYLAVNYPLKSLRENRIEVFNEASIYLCCQLMTNFLNVSIPLGLKDKLGYILMGVAAFNTVTNLALVVVGTISDGIDSCRLGGALRKARAAWNHKQGER